jgi:TonB family protein
VRKTVLALASLFCMSFAMAQSASDAVTKERMERAKRDASNPLRIIIEASQVKRTKAADSPPAAPAPAAEARPAEPAKPVAQRKPPRVAEAVPEPAPVTAPAPLNVAADPAARQPAAQRTAVPGAEAPSTNPAPEASASTAGTAPLAAAPQVAAPVSAAPLSAAPLAAAPLAAAPAAASLAAPAAASLPNPAQPAAEVLAPLKLVRYIEPEIPARIRSRLRPSSEVTVAFKVQTDGSVSNVGIRATNARALDPVVLEAVRQWRYDPVPEEREHVVQLVFNLTE